MTKYILCVALVGCGGASTQLSGVPNGAFTPKSVVGEFDQNTPYLAVSFSTLSGQCGVLQQEENSDADVSSEPPNERELQLFIADGNDDSEPSSSGPLHGTYSVDGNTTLVQATYVRFDDQGQNVEQWNEQSGTVTISENTPSVLKGNIDLVLALVDDTGDSAKTSHVTGTFAASHCTNAPPLPDT
jgi:hypothetical protein